MSVTNTPTNKLRGYLDMMAKYMELFSAELLDAAKLAASEKDLPAREQLVSSLERMQQLTVNVVSHVQGVKALVAGQLTPVASDEKSDEKKEEKKKKPEESWTICDGGCDRPVPVSATKKRLGHDWCLECLEKAKARRTPVSETKAGGEGKTDDLKNALSMLNAVTEAKKSMQRFTGVHTVLSFHVSESRAKDLAASMQRYTLNIEKCANEIRQMLGEMEIACDQEILRHHKQHVPGATDRPD